MASGEVTSFRRSSMLVRLLNQGFCCGGTIKNKAKDEWRAVRLSTRKRCGTLWLLPCGLAAIFLFFLQKRLTAFCISGLPRFSRSSALILSSSGCSGSFINLHP